MTGEVVSEGRRTVTWETDQPVRLFNIVAGKWKVRQGENTVIYYHPAHDFNVDGMGRVLDAARKYTPSGFTRIPGRS